MKHHDFWQFSEYELSLWEEEEISEEAATVGFSLQHGGVTMCYRVTGSSRGTQQGRKLYLLHFSILSPEHTMTMFADIARRKIEQNLFDAATAGGMMGGYLEEGFPFYYINQKMLDYLGYADEAEFITDNQGMILNCMHPDDRERVNEETNSQILKKGEYQVEYRMRKQDGSYIWVHDIGSRISVENGREAILSVCYDITREKEHSNLIENLVDTMNGGVALYQVNADWRLIPIYISAGVGRISNRNNEEYEELCREDVMNSIYQEDRDSVKRSMMEAITNDKVTSITYRILDKEEGYLWINGFFSRFGKRDGFPVLHAVFTPVSVQYDLQLQALDQTSTGIDVLDENTRELYYANEASFLMHGTEPCDYAGKTCHEVYFAKKEPCDNCWRKEFRQDQNWMNSQTTIRDRVIEFHIERKKWHGRNVLIEYSHDVTEQALLTMQLRRNEEINEAACKFAGLWVWNLNLDTMEIYPNKILQKDFGLPVYMKDYPESLLAYHYVLPAYEEEYRNKVRQMQEGAAEVEMEIQMRYRDGTPHWIRIRLNRLTTESAETHFAIGSALPIDQEKALEAMIRLERQKTIGYDPSLLCYVIVNVTRDSVLENSRFSAIVPSEDGKISMKQLMDRLLYHLYDKKEGLSFRELHNREALLSRYEGGETTVQLEGRMVTPDHRICWVRTILRLLKDPGSGDIYLYEYMYDIQQQKILEEIVRAAVNYDYERLGSVYLNTNRSFFTYNKKERQELAVLEEDYTAVSSAYGNQVVLAEDREMFQRMISLPVVIRQLAIQEIYEFTHRTLEHGEIHVKRNRFVIYDTQNRIALMTRMDITELVKEDQRKRQRLQRTLDELQLANTGRQHALEAAEAASRAKSEFLSRMSHEIRTPMNAIMGMTSIAKESGTDYTQVSECLDKIDMSSHYLLTLINDILEMSRIESGHTEIGHAEFDFAFLLESIHTIVESLAHKTEIQLEFLNHTTGDSNYLGDMMRIQQILVNLISNAIKFTKPGGHVRFTAEVREQTQRQTVFRFTIADTGIGMSEDFMSRMFKPFSQEDSKTTSKYNGSGLGLPIAKSLTDAMGGQIQVESVVGVGSTFTVELPLDRIQHGEPVEKEQKGTAKNSSVCIDTVLRGIHVLLVEDHQLNIMVATRLLERKGITVTLTGNGLLAVEQFAASEQGEIDAILMDIRMPVMDGLDAARKIRALPRKDAKTVPIIAMTANALYEDRRRSKEAGMNAHLAKPYEPEQLYQVLAEQVSRRENE